MTFLSSPNSSTSNSLRQVYAEDTGTREISDGDIEKFGKLIGINLELEPQLRYLCEEGLLAPLPTGWKPCRDLTKDQWYYHNSVNNRSQWEHPLNEVYREKAAEARKKMNAKKPPPPKSLPPLKKIGASRPPSGLGAPRNSLGPLRNSKLQIEDQLSLAKSEDNLPQPSSRTVKKPSLLLTAEEEKLLQELEIPLQDKLKSFGSTKFQLDSSSEFKFESVDSSEASEGSSRNLGAVTKPLKAPYPSGPNQIGPQNKAKSSPRIAITQIEESGEEESSEQSSSTTSTASGDKQRVAIHNAGAGENVHEALNLEEMKSALRQNMEEALKTYQQQLDAERKRREAELKKELEQALGQIRKENETSIKKAKDETEKEKNKLKQKLELELEQLKQNFDKTKHENETKTNNAELKHQKDALREDQKKQLQQMKDYHQSIIEKLKKEFQTEQAKLQAEHEAKRKENSSKLAAETLALQEKQRAEQDAKLRGLKAEFEKEKGKISQELQTGMSEIRKEFKNAKAAASVATSPKISIPLKEAEPLQTSEVKILGEKYKQLEKKYSFLKKELRKLTDANKSKANERENSLISSASESSFYPSTFQTLVPPPPPVESEDEDDENNDGGPFSEILEENSDRLACALKSLETLRAQILEMQRNSPKRQEPKVNVSTPRSSNKYQLQSQSPSKKRNSEKNLSKRGSAKPENSARKSVPTTPTTAGANKDKLNNKRTRLRPSKSTSELPGLIEDSDVDEKESPSRAIMKEAQEFIRVQRQRLKPDQLHQPQNLFVQRQHPVSVVVRPATAALECLYSETESSGIGSMFNGNLKSNEKKKISKDIESICSSLSALDEQMKLMWSVVNSNSKNNSPSTYPPFVPFVPHSARQLPVPGKNPSSASNVRMSPSNLVNSLDRELQNFTATKERILSQFASSKGANNAGNNSTSGGRGDSSSVQDKTKDLREWLEKF